jgi:hypothetical protein
MVTTILQENQTPVTTQGYEKSDLHGFIMFLWRHLKKEINFTYGVCVHETMM